MKVLIACEFSQIVCKAFRDKGHDAWSCDLLETLGDPKYHIKRNVLEILDDGWDMMIAHPPCTYLSSSGLHWNKKDQSRQKLTDEAIEFVKKLWYSNIPKIAIENPIGCLSTKMEKPTQIIQPYEFGEDASKRTCLWLKNLPKLVGTKYVPPRMVDGKPRWGNQTDSGQNRLGPSEDRWKLRSLTYKGIAEAMSNTWG